MRRGTLLTQVLTVNLLLIAAAVIAASIASNPESSLRDSATIGLVLGFALAATVAVNIWLLSRRFEPLGRLVTEMENADLSKPPTAPAVAAGPHEVVSLERSFHAMLERLEAERRSAANAALGAQERERMTLVVTKVYFKDGRIKLELCVAKGKKLFDKRATLRQRDADKEARTAIREGKKAGRA